MRISHVCALLGAAFVTVSAQASDVCPATPATAVEVQSAVIQPEFKTDTVKHLTALAEEVRPGEADGLTVIVFGEDDSVTESRNRHGCTTFDVQVNLRPESATVFMADTSSPASCRYRAVMGHEMHHVQIAQDAIDHTATALQKQLETALPQAIIHLQASHLGRVSAQDVQAFVKKRAHNALRIVSAEYQAGNERLDVPAESERLYNMCAPQSHGPHAYIGSERVN